MRKKFKIREIKAEIEHIYGWKSRIIRSYMLRVTDDDKVIDLFPRKYHKLETHERGFYTDYLSLLHHYFLVER